MFGGVWVFWGLAPKAFPLFAPMGEPVSVAG